MKFNSLFFILTIFTSCKSKEIEHNYMVTKYQKVGEGYSYLIDLMKYNDGVYRPLISSVYSKDRLIAATKYKPEGKIDHDRKELLEDPLFKETLNLRDVRIIVIRENEIVDNGRKYRISERKDDSIFCMQADTLFLYKVR
jgi:hypothetical protein